MLKLKQKYFRGQFLPTLEKLMEQDSLNQKVAYNLSKLATGVQNAAKAAQVEFIALVEKHAVKNEKGEVEPHNGPGTFKIAKENEAEWLKAVSEFEEKEVELAGANPFMVADFAQAKLSAKDYMALEPILRNFGAV